MKLKKIRSYNKINLALIIFIFLLIAIVYVLKIFNEKAIPIFVEYSETEVRRIATLMINNTVTNETAKNTTLDDLFIIKEDNNGNIISLDINSAKANQILTSTNTILEQNFKYMENGEIDKLKIDGLNIDNNERGVIYKIPSGIIFDNVFLNNLFPKIPVRLNLAGNIFSKLTTEVESYGINNAIFKVNIQTTVNLKVVLPFTSSNIELVTAIPIIIKIIEGDVPSYYFSGSV